MRLVKLKPIVFQSVPGGAYTGYLQNHPAVCAQGDTSDDVCAKLSRFAKLYFDYMSNAELELDNPISETL